MTKIFLHKDNLTLIFLRILLIAGFLAFLHVVYFNFKYIFDQKLKAGYIIYNNTFLVFSAVLLFLGTAGFLLTGLTAGSKHLAVRNYIIITTVIAFTLRLAFVLLFKTAPISDFWLLYRSGEEVVKGNFDFVKKAEYFLSWVYQIGFVTYQAFVIKIFGPGYLALKVLNTAFSTGICILIYLTGKRIFNEAAGRIAGLAYCFYPASIYMCTVLTNQILSAFLF
jgi:hypothetical protein